MTADLIEWGATAAVLSGAWIAVVLVLRRPVSRWLGARWAYALWLLPVVAVGATLLPGQLMQQAVVAAGITVPLLDTLNSTLFTLADSAVRGTRLEVLGGPASAPFTAADGLLLAWVAGALIVLLPFVMRHIQASTRLLATSRRLTGDEIRRLKNADSRLVDRPLATLRVLDTTDGPAVAGFSNPVLMLPCDFFTRFDPQQQALMLEHEFEHLRRHDLVALVLARIFRSLFWFNPLAHLAERYLRLDQEASCDERVLQASSPSVRRIYGETLLLATRPHDSRQTAAAWSPTYSHIRPRLFQLRRHGQTPARRMAGRAFLLVSVALCFVLGDLADPQQGGTPEVRQGLLRQAELEYRRGDRVGALQALAESERLSPAGLPPRSLVLRGRIFVELGSWAQAYDAIDTAIARSEAAGTLPDEAWLLARTALQWKLGDLDGAARSLERSMGRQTGTSFEGKLALFNEVVQDTWEPAVAESVWTRP